jgi:TolB-like protein
VIYRFNDYELDTQRYQLCRLGNLVSIEPQVFDLLHYLLANRGKLVSRDELFDSIWSGRVVSDTSLSNHIKSARKAIGDNGRDQNSIKTIHGRGYQFVAETSEQLNHGNDLSTFSTATRSSKNENLGPFVAVLPFQNLSSDTDQNYFAEGMSEDITTELSRFTDIQVIARHTAFQYNSAALDIKKIGEELEIEYLIEGSVRRTEDSVRVNIQLIETANEKHVWAEKFDRPIDDIFKIQDEITETVVSTVTGQIRRIETERSHSRGTDNLRAYDHLLRGLSYHKNGNVSYEDEVKATRELEQAIALDPKFARPRAWIICTKSGMWWEDRTDEMIHALIEDGKYALTLDELESETHRILGSLYLYLRNYQLAGHHFKHAQHLSPNDAHVTVKLGRYYAYTDQLDKALQTVQRAMRLNPMHPGWYWQELGIVNYSMGDYQKAIENFYKNPDIGSYDLAWIGASQAAQGNTSLARQAARKAIEMEPKASVYKFTKFDTYQDISRHDLLCDRMISAGIPS